MANNIKFETKYASLTNLTVAVSPKIYKSNGSIEEGYPQVMKY